VTASRDRGEVDVELVEHRHSLIRRPLVHGKELSMIPEAPTGVWVRSLDILHAFLDEFDIKRLPFASWDLFSRLAFE
jgi:hypothetical protein